MTRFLSLMKIMTEAVHRWRHRRPHRYRTNQGNYWRKFGNQKCKSYFWGEKNTNQNKNEEEREKKKEENKKEKSTKIQNTKRQRRTDELRR